MKGSLPRMTMIIILIIALSAVITTLSFTAFYYMVTNSDKAASANGENEHPAETIHATTLEYTLEPFTTNLADDKRYIQINITLLYPEVKQKTWFGLRETVDDTLPLALASHVNQIRDAIITVLGKQHSASLRGSGLATMKADIVTQVNKLLPTSVGITGVNIVDMVIP